MHKQAPGEVGGSGELDATSAELNKRLVDNAFSAIVRSIPWRRQEPLYVSGVEENVQIALASRFESETRVVMPFRKFVDEAKRDSLKAERTILGKSVVLWGFYPESKEHGHSTDDVLLGLNVMRAASSMHKSDQPISHLVLAKDEFDFTAFTPEQVRRSAFPLINYPTFGHVVGDELKGYRPRHDSYEKLNF